MQKLKIAYLSGPVDAAEAYKAWIAGAPLGYFGSSHIKDFFSLCSALNAESYVITTLESQYSCVQLGQSLIENRPMPAGVKGIAYHISHLFWLARMIPAIIRFRPHFLIITAAQNYWPILAVLTTLGISIIPVYTCTLWPKFAPVRFSLRILLSLNRIFLSRYATAVVAMSEDIARQVRVQLRGRKISVTTFLPVYERDQFAMLVPRDFNKRPFNVFFAGRMEKNKGIYDLVDIAQRLNQRKDSGFHFDVCGDGSELRALTRHIADLGVTKVMTCHGYCERSRLSTLLQESHVVIVPTTTDFEEGFNMVCAEAILASRPLVTSPVCPALEYVKEASIEVPPDDVEAYSQALLDLSNDRELYERKLAACKPLQEQFYMVSNGWGAKLREVIEQNLAAGLGQK
jgi:glycogen synthase